MKILRAYILADTLLLIALGMGTAFIHPGSFPGVYLEVEVSRNSASLGLVAAGLGALALVLWMSTELPLAGDRRRLAFGLSFANFLIAAVASLQMDLWGRALGWSLVVAFLGLAAGLAWTGLRSRRPAEIAAEIAALRIPDEIRHGLLRQIEEAAAQEERNRLARDLHDSIKQQLFSINVGTAAAQERWERDPEGARKALADVRRSAREAMVEMQAMLHQLRPEALGTAGLIEALREQCEALGYRSGAEVALELGEPIPDDRMPPGAPETLFRMAQEMLANVARHARARRVRLWLGRQDEAVVLRIEDDGQGFDPGVASSGMGLRNLKERAESMRGKLEITSTPGSGAGLMVRIPLVSPPLPARADGRRLMISEFLIMTVMAIVSFPVGLGPILWMAEGYKLFVVFLVLLYTIVWPLQQYAPRASRPYANHKGDVLIRLLIGWWALGQVTDMKMFTKAGFWTLLILILWSITVALIRLHRASEIRRFWRKGARIWLSLVLLMEAGTLLALGSIVSKPGPLALNVLKAFVWLAMGVVFAYVASRQPRAKGAYR